MKPRWYALPVVTALLAVVAVTPVLAQNNNAQPGGTPSATSNPIQLRTEIYIVSEVTNKDGSKSEKLTKADSARPGQIVEYRLFAKNVSNTTLPSGVVQISTPVPNGMQYVPNSATPSSSTLLTEFSADGGKTFSKPPVLTGTGADRKVAEPTSYTNVRWTVLSSMEPGQEVPFFYR
ncbi:MAG: hypothetical protein P8Z81_04645, partial [Deinococcales bacterium]